MKSKTKEFVAEVITNWRAPYIGIVLILIPFYFYFVENYYYDFYNWILNVLGTSKLVGFGAILAIIGFSLIFQHYEYKASKSNKVIIKLNVNLMMSLGILSASWTVSKDFAYMNVWLFIASAYLFLILMRDTFTRIKEFYLKLDSIERVALIVPILTVLLGKIIN